MVTPMTRGLAIVASLMAGVTLTGCGGDPPIYEIKGQVTLGGKAYPRLLVYFRPASGEVNRFNMGVGETDQHGHLVVRSNTGVGLPAGEYTVTFSCQVPRHNTPASAKLSADDKPSEVGITMVELVPDSHLEGKANSTTPVRFTVTSSENVFIYDIPAK
ncbi:MAG: hypothetical protein RMJ56_11245 [Gemmataceae bacterium]|nr:hypothetical protein [Gemmata sp.]MDW8198165.1 hypothetical protein [Gemmataceae bacterium]